MEKEIITKSKLETQLMGEKIAKVLKPGDVITLDGDLGAGKTTFSQGIARGLAIKENVNSPTFNILKCYFSGSLPLYHIDAYRLEEGINDNIGLEEVIEGDGVCLVEWSKFIEDKIFEPLKITIAIIDDNTRKFTFETEQSKYDDVFSLIREF